MTYACVFGAGLCSESGYESEGAPVVVVLVRNYSGRLVVSLFIVC